MPLSYCRPTVVAGVLCAALIAGPTMPRAVASGHGAPAEGHGAAPKHSGPPMIDLGDFYIENFRPTHNEHGFIHFSLHVALKEETSDATIERLKHWQKRMRDQAITAVRSIGAAELAEPELARVQRMILIRLKRMPLTDLIERLYVTDFSVGEG